MNIIQLQVMFEWSLEWDCKEQISLPTGTDGKLKPDSSCTVIHKTYIKEQQEPIMRACCHKDLNIYQYIATFSIDILIRQRSNQ